MQRGVKIGGPLDFVANTATGGAFRANLVRQLGRASPSATT